ncbi:oxygen-independent coproporphyrinogen III oxidase [Aliarcobacter cibarius]|uniref:radical SAM family heme chaperone HemW n=1 Tax=Aliarcobacter cibarius TaxID=255507 RepID=UPI00124582CD|nr:radical SAM family heme chaperone HemW [Aliarcobacter cibarius]QEZ89172.1 oxygen-independent coproporphyrinogen III oxidase [Aliarcobacter cibarius]
MLLYIHIPFCDSKCFYCAFNSYTTKFKLKDDYMDALKKQLANNLKRHLINTNKKIETVFIGGGTPSTIKASSYKELFDLIKPYLIENAEITTEANPNSATLSWQQEMFDLGVNRISFGVQSFDEKKLKFLGRAHSSQSAIEAVNNAKKVGFKKINCDIIYGVVNDSFETLKKDFDIVKDLGINHISAYSLIIEENTKFFLDEKSLKKEKKSLKIDDEDLSYEIFDYLAKLGFKQYEIANFATSEEFESKHNYGYWKHREYLGVGAGAVACINNTREYSEKNIEKYIENPLSVEKEELSLEDIKAEKVLLGFRCKFGVEIELLNKNELKRAEDLITEKKLELKDNRIFNNNYLLADELALYILD